jgi:hypothetical protein
MSLEDLEKALYGEEDKKNKKSEFVKSEQPKVFSTWPSIEKKNSKVFLFSNLRKLGGFLGWSLAAIIVASFSFWLASVDRVSGGLEVSIIAPTEVRRGVPLEVVVEVFNRMEQQLEEGNLELRLPNGLVFIESPDRASQSRTLGLIQANTLLKQTFKILPVAEENSIREISVDFSYKRGKNLFSSMAEHELKIQKAFLSLEAELPERILRGGSLPIGLKLKNELDSDSPAFLVRAEYPSSFIPQESETEGEAGVWRFSSLTPSEEKKISVKGVFQSSDNRPLTVPFKIIIPLGLKEFTIAEKVVVVEAAPSPVVLNISLNNSDGLVAKFGDTLSYSVNYRNESGVALSGVTVRLGLVGSWFDWSSVQTDGAFDSVRNEVVWTSSQVPEFKLLEPNASGELELSIRLLAAPTRVSGSYSVRVSARLDSPTVPHYLEADQTSVSTSLETKLNGPVYLDARALHRDPDSGFVNNGPFPPKVGEKTEYTVHWILRNFSNELKNVSLSASLPAGVEWSGHLKNSDSPEPIFDSSTNKIVWNLTRIAPGRGASSVPVEAVFQIIATPSVSMVGSFQPLLSETVLEALVSFTGTEVLIRDIGLSTRLPDDSTVGENQGRVVP